MPNGRVESRCGTCLYSIYMAGVGEEILWIFWCVCCVVEEEYFIMFIYCWLFRIIIK